MDFNQAMKPYRIKLVIEALIRAIMTGLFFGLALSLVSACVFRFIVQEINAVAWIVTLGVGVATAIAIGVSTYLKRFRSNQNKLAKRIDALGLDERVTTMVEFKKDRSYVAKVQREDTMDRVSKLNIKQLKIRFPLFRIISCTAMLLAVLLLLSIVPPISAAERETLEMEEHLERIQQELHQMIDESDTTDAFKDRTKDQVDKRIEEIRNNNDLTNAQKIFMAEMLKDRLLTSIEIQKEIYEIRDIIDAAVEEGLSESFADMLHSIVDRLEKRLDVTKTDLEKYEDIRATRKEIEKLIEEQLEMLDQTIDQMEKDNEELKDELEKTENETLQDIVDKMDQVEEKQDQVDQKQEQVDQAQDKLDQAQNEQQKQEAQEELDQANKELEDAKQELEDAKQEIGRAHV